MDKGALERISKHYSLGKLKQFKKLPQGFHSDNLLIESKKGKFVLKKLHEGNERDVKYILKIYEFLDLNGIKTAKPIKTIKNKLYIKFDGGYIALQKYVDGKSLRASKSSLIKYGSALGKTQKVLSTFTLKGRSDFTCLKVLKKLAKDYMPQDKYVKGQYELLIGDFLKIDFKKLTKAIIHADSGLDDFRFKNGKFMGILDFGDAHRDYILYDVATFLMYSGIYQKSKNKEYSAFIRAYLKEFALPKTELKVLHVFLRTRALIQVLYHWSRYKEGLSQGQKTAKDNLNGVRSGKRMLRLLEELPKEFYFIKK